jgi:hypothetical protein
MKSTANTLYDAWKRDGDPHFYDLPESERARWEAVAAEVDRMYPRPTIYDEETAQ